MQVCPRCERPLVRVKRREGIAFQCPGCRGCALGLAVLRKIVSRELVKNLWLLARRPQQPRGLRCAICRRPMRQVPMRIDGHRLVLDVCARCQFAWFDTGELDELPRAPRERRVQEVMPMEARERLALA